MDGVIRCSRLGVIVSVDDNIPGKVNTPPPEGGGFG
jgi:hypothetical protein